jgi:hypothetical protein
MLSGPDCDPELLSGPSSPVVLRRLVSHNGVQSLIRRSAYYDSRRSSLFRSRRRDVAEWPLRVGRPRPAFRRIAAQGCDIALGAWLPFEPQRAARLRPFPETARQLRCRWIEKLWCGERRTKHETIDYVGASKLGDTGRGPLSCDHGRGVVFLCARRASRERALAPCVSRRAQLARAIAPTGQGFRWALSRWRRNEPACGDAKGAPRYRAPVVESARRVRSHNSVLAMSLRATGLLQVSPSRGAVRFSCGASRDARRGGSHGHSE